MDNFNGPKFQQGKLGGDWEDALPDSKELAKRLARKAKISSVTIDDKEVLYIYCDIGDRNYTHRHLKSMAKEIKDTFQESLGVSVIVGYYDMKFTPITKKQAFKGKLDGQI